MEIELLKILAGSGVDVNTITLGIMWVTMHIRVKKLEWHQSRCCGD